MVRPRDPRHHGVEMSTIGERVRQAREVRGLGVNELARQAQLSNRQISRIERAAGEAKRGITNKTLAKLATALQVRPEWLLTGKGPREETLEHELPRRAEAIRIAREGGVSEEVIKVVLALPVADPSTKTAWWWLQVIARREALLKEEGTLPPASEPPMTVASPALSSRLRPVVK